MIQKDWKLKRKRNEIYFTNPKYGYIMLGKYYQDNKKDKPYWMFWVHHRNKFEINGMRGTYFKRKEAMKDIHFAIKQMEGKS